MMIVRNILVIAAIVCLSVGSVVAQATPAAPLAPTLRAIEGNADAARANARIYQWQRVNLEVGRIAADEHTLEAAGDANASLRAAVLSLRSARQAHNPDATVRAASAVSALCASLAR